MKLLKSFSVYHSLPSIHNKTVAERETKYSQTFVQQSPFGNGIRVTVIYAAVDRYMQVNFGENIIKATGNFGKLFGDHNIQGDRYIQGSYNTGLTVLRSLETKKETKSNTSVCVGITAYGDFKQDLSRVLNVELSAYLSFLLFLFFFCKIVRLCYNNIFQGAVSRLSSSLKEIQSFSIYW